MTPSEFAARLERPWWSPEHPSLYRSRSGPGWSILYPDYVEVFNLFWLASGCWLPPFDTTQFLHRAEWVTARQEWKVSDKLSLRQAAGRPINEFEALLLKSAQPLRFSPLLANIKKHKSSL